MPEPAVAAETTAASIPSEPSSAGGNGGLDLSSATDEDILGITEDSPSPAPAATPETPEAAAPAETSAEPKEETPAPLPTPTDEPRWADNKFMRPLFNDKVYGPVVQSMRDSLLAFRELYPTVADARAVKELLPGGAEELKGLLANKRETDEMDLQFFGGDEEQQKAYLQTLYRDDQQSFESAIRNGLDLIKAQSPQEWAYLTQHYVGQSLEAEKVWDWLEYIHESATKSGDTNTAQLLNQFAGIFQKFGLSPREQEDPNLQRVNQAKGEFDRERAAWQAERQKEFSAETDRNVTAALDTSIGAELTRLLPKTSDGLRQKIARDVHAEIQKAVRADSGLSLRVRNLLRAGGYNRQSQEQLSNLLVSKAKLILPGAVKRVVNEYTASIMSARKEVNDKQNAAASRPDVSGGSRPRTGPRVLTREEARDMSFEDILNSDRPAGR